MNKLYRAIKAFIRDEEGLTAVEYVVGAAFLVGAIAFVMTNYGNNIDAKLNTTITNVDSTGGS